MTDLPLEEFLATAEEAARAGGRVLRDWEGRFAVREKGFADLVTDADLDSQRTIRKIVLDRFPDHAFLGEETDVAASSDSADPTEHPYRWIVDPLDGTTNYVHRCPFYSVSVALEHRGELLVGVIFDPFTGECFRAARGKGARLGENPLRVSATDKLADALVVTSFPPGVQRHHDQVHHFIEVLVRSQSLRRTGSAALNLAYVAAGRFDAFWASSMHPWDVAAGVLLVTEAGGRCTDFHGRPYNIHDERMLVSNATALHEEITGLLTHPDLEGA